MQENPVISDWVPISGGSTEGSLGGWLAQRQAALRGMLAAGALSTFTLGLPCVPLLTRAPRVPRENISGNDWALGLGHRDQSRRKTRSQFRSIIRCVRQ